MKSVLFTKHKGSYIHTLHRNFIEQPPKGYKYLDLGGRNFNSSLGENKKSSKNYNTAQLLKSKLYTFTKRYGFLTFLQKIRSGRKYVEQIDSIDPDLIYGLNGQLYLGDKPWVVDFEDPLVFAGHNTATLKYRKRMKKIFQKDNCKGIIAYSKTDKDSFLEIFGRDLEEKVYVSYNVVDTPENREKIEHDDFTLLYTGSVNVADGFYYRGGRETLRAFKKFNQKHPSSQLIVRSKIPEEERDQVQHEDIKVIEELLPRREFHNLFRKSDLYIHPSYKGCALSIPEAMSFGLPIVGSNIVENDEYIENGENGLKAQANHVEYEFPGVPSYYGTDKIPSLNEDYIDRIAEKIEILFNNP